MTADHRAEMWGGIVDHYLASKTRPMVDVYLSALGSLGGRPRAPQIEEEPEGNQGGPRGQL